MVNVGDSTLLDIGEQHPFYHCLVGETRDVLVRGTLVQRHTVERDGTELNSRRKQRRDISMRESGAF